MINVLLEEYLKHYVTKIGLICLTLPSCVIICIGVRQ